MDFNVGDTWHLPDQLLPELDHLPAGCKRQVSITILEMQSGRVELKFIRDYRDDDGGEAEIINIPAKNLAILLTRAVQKRLAMATATRAVGMLQGYSTASYPQHS
jgi:hypothetical protein